ncbi:MAG: phospholipase [Alphaproteobacteria bacterium]|jgi:phosphatidylserine/phosphatidylglycerophosphate/cardiolipin synthase-like enzyme|nr:phospholipase [Alphaproteobacteria bacterium]MBU2040814.1 phospholipase [Alphaproteobacteria bacterium]MBU2126137.1 phospholipase [Alphaproteobacteria bacterium]MBU2208824.1 phospholipase [Alphaproteobacteria bacterium]MBU2291434.1 phospholipase [Alphaproteobacteria bacterium]
MIESGPDQNRSLLKPGQNCWRVEQAGRFAVLMENAAYFEALRSAFAKARRSIVILGWQFDPRTRLDPHSAHDDHLAQIGHQLRMLVKARPELDVRLLIWKSPLLIAASQGFYPHRARVWFRKRMVEFRLDPPPAIGACHHQKVIVIDDAVAFCGGGDISTDRWDSEQHLDDDPRRCQPSGLIPSPRHEVMAVMDGAAARALGDLARERWFRATGERTMADEVDGDPWPDGVEPDLRQTPVAIVRTEPAAGGRAEVRENEVLHLDAIRQAKRLIYMENQYFTSPVIAEALAARLGEIDGPEVVLVSTGTSPSWFDRITMDTARSEVLYRLEQADRHNRFFAFAPHTREGERIIVHAKVSIYDDAVLRIGSTNLNNRSFGFDTECDIAAEPLDAGGREAIRRFRQRTIGHWIGVDGEAFGAVEAITGTVGEAILQFDTGRMHTLGAVPPSRLERIIAEFQLGDPTSPRDAFRPWKRRTRSHRTLPAPTEP